MRQALKVRGGEFNLNKFPKTKKWVSQILEKDWFENEIMKKVKKP